MALTCPSRMFGVQSAGSSLTTDDCGVSEAMDGTGVANTAMLMRVASIAAIGLVFFIFTGWASLVRRTADRRRPSRNRECTVDGLQPTTGERRYCRASD